MNNRARISLIFAMVGLLSGNRSFLPEQRIGNSYNVPNEKYGQPFYFNRAGEIVSKKSDQEKICIRAKSHKEALSYFKTVSIDFDETWLIQNS